MSASITVSVHPRGLPGPGQSGSVTFTAAQCVATWSWGLQPGTALIDWVSAQAQSAIVSGAAPQIDVGCHTFWGFCQNVVLRVGTDGYTLMQEFKDNREFLMWDTVQGAFNLQDNRIVNGQYIRRYKHLLPADVANNEWTYTTIPYQD